MGLIFCAGSAGCADLALPVARAAPVPAPLGGKAQAGSTVRLDGVVFCRLGGVPASLPVYVLDGRLLSADEFRRVDLTPAGVVTVEIMKGPAAAARYGPAAANGAILVTTRAAPSPVVPAEP